MIPSLKPGQVLVIDNASFHKSKTITDLVEKAGCTVFFLPPYSPHLNRIEHFWLPIKNNIRKLLHSIDDFYNAAVQTLGEMCSTT